MPYDDWKTDPEWGLSLEEIDADDKSDPEEDEIEEDETDSYDPYDDELRSEVRGER